MPLAFVLQKPMGTLLVTSQSQAREHGWVLIHCSGLLGKLGPVPPIPVPTETAPEGVTSQDWNPAVPTGGFCGTQKGERKGTEGWISLSGGSSLIAEALV